MPYRPPTVEEQISVLQRIKEFVDLNRAELELAYSQRRLAAVAWLARNLLELAIWSEHCSLSKENAREFLLDAARDALDALNIPDGPWLRNSLKTARQHLLDNATADGFDMNRTIPAFSGQLRNWDVKIHSRFSTNCFRNMPIQRHWRFFPMATTGKTRSWRSSTRRE